VIVLASVIEIDVDDFAATLSDNRMEELGFAPFSRMPKRHTAE
jgi:hypothetical protein